MSKVIFNKEILTTLEEFISPQHTALIIVDAQNDFCSPGGCFSQLKSADMEMTKSALERLAEVLAAARRARLMIIYTQAANPPSLIFKSPPDIARKLEYLNPDSPLICVEGEWGYQIVDELKPLPDELIIKKHRHSSFAGTPLDMLLRSNGIKTVIITGFSTERCVLATVTGAIANDYYVVVPEDCVASPYVEMHHAALTVISGNLCREEMTDSRQIISLWQR
jgi:nicotinamidase-related amidase